jgi:hypothetical protein
MNRFALLSPVAVIALGLTGVGQAQTGASIHGIAPGMSHAAALKILSAKAQCTVAKESLDEGWLPAGTYDLYTSCRLNDGQGSISYRTTSSLMGDKIRDVELVSHSREQKPVAVAALARKHGVVLEAAELKGDSWSWQLSGHRDLAIFAYPGTGTYATVLRDTELSRQDDLAISSNIIARAIPGGAVRG